MGKSDSSGIILLVVGGVAAYFMIKTCTIQKLIGQGGSAMQPILDMINQIGNAVGATCAGTVTTTTPSLTTPPSGGEVPTNAQGGPANCDCSCMPMDSDPGRLKIETPAGVDCVNHDYFGPENAAALCAEALTKVCLTRGGSGSGGGTQQPAATKGGNGYQEPTSGSGSGGGGKGKGKGKDDEDEDSKEEDESNYARASYDYYLEQKMLSKISPPTPLTLYPIDALTYSV